MQPELIIEEVSHTDRGLTVLSVGDIVRVYYKKSEASIDNPCPITSYIFSVAEDRVIISNVAPNYKDKPPFLTEKRLTIRKNRIASLERILKRYEDKKSSETSQ